MIESARCTQRTLPAPCTPAHEYGRAYGMEKAVRYLTLVLTTGCNLRCSYCYRGESGQHAAMPLDAALDALSAAHAGGAPFHVQLTGGEPLLEPELLRAIIGHIRRENMTATVGVQTNATLLSPDMAGFLREHAVLVGVSVDGAPRIQEKTRGNARALLRGLAVLETAGAPFRVTTVLVRDTLPGLAELPLFLANYRQAKGIAFDLPVLKGRMTEAMLPSAGELAEALQKFLRAFETVNTRLRVPLTLRELETLLRACRREAGDAAPAGQRHYCHASRGESLAVGPYGEVRACGQLTESGQTHCPDSLPARPDVNLAGHHLAFAECAACELRHVCPGDCPSRLLHTPPAAARLACALYTTLWRNIHA